jgi:hypothetical protein
MLLPLSYEDFRLYVDMRRPGSPPPAPPRRPGRRGLRRIR